jgi:transposase
MTHLGHSRLPRTGGGFGRVRCASESGSKIKVMASAATGEPQIMRCELSDAPFQQDQECRRVAMRYDKLAANYRAFIQLASIRLWLR